MTFARAGGSMVDVQPSDSQLGRALARGDRAGSDALLERYWPRAYGLALRLTGRPADAADAVQDAFAEVWRHRARFDAERAFRPWLFRIVSRAALSRARSEGRRRAREERSARGEAHTPDLEERLRVQERLLELEPELRAAVALKVLEGFTFRELADALEIPEGTAASRVRRGLERLRGQEERTPAALAPLLALLPGELPPLPVWRGAARAGRALVGLGLLGALSVGIVGAALAVGGAGRTGVEAGPTPAGAPRESASAAAATSARRGAAASDAARPPLAVAAAPGRGGGAARGRVRGFVLRDRVRGEPVTEREVRVHQRLRGGGVETGPARTGPRGELEVALAPGCDALAVELEGVTTPTCALPPRGPWRRSTGRRP
ncbi:MAG: RNA polymerase sigma factor [Planctomycetota bacterium]